MWNWAFCQTPSMHNVVRMGGGNCDIVRPQMLTLKKNNTTRET